MFADKTCKMLCASALLLALARPALAASPTPTPVEVDEVVNRSRSSKLDLVAVRLTDTLRRALGATGRFTVLRPDLAAEVKAAQKRYLSHVYEASSAPEVGSFVAAKVLVKAELRTTSRKELVVAVSFVDVERLTAISSMDLEVRAPADREDKLRISLAVAVAERAATALGGGKAELDAGRRYQVEALARGSSNGVALDAHTEGRRAAQGLTYAGLLSAVEHFEAAVRLDPNFAVAHADLAHALAELYWIGLFVGETEAQRFSRLEAARQAVERAEVLAPRAEVVLRAAAQVHMLSGNTDVAKANLHEARRINPNDPALLVIEAQLATSNRDRVAKLEAAVALDPHDVAARFGLALAHEAAGRIEQARDAYIATLKEADPRHPVSLINLAWSLLPDGQLSLARQLLGVALAREPRFANAYTILALVDDLEGRSPDRQLSRALARSPEVALHFAPPPPAGRAAHEHAVRQAERLVARYPKSTLAAVYHATRLAESSEEEAQARAVLIFSRLEAAGRIRSSDVYARYYRARALRRVGDHAEAASILEDLVPQAESPRTKAYLQLQLARALSAKSDYSRARTVLTQMVEQAPSAVHRAVGQVDLAAAYREGEFDLARRVLERARGEPAVAVWAEVTLGGILAEEHASVVAALRRASSAQARRALELRRDRLRAGTRAAYARALERAPNTLAAFAGLARFSWSIGDRDEALEAWGRAAEIDPEWLPVLAGRLHQAGRSEEAERQLNEATAKDPASHVLAFYRGQFFERTGRSHRAGLAYADAYHLRPSWTYVTAAADAFAAADEHDRGIRILKEGLQEDPGRAAAYHNRIAVLEAARERLAAALFHLLKARAAAGSGSYLVLQNLAVVYARKGELAKAEQSYEAAIAANPAHADLYIGFAHLLESNDAIARARKVLERGLVARPRDRRLRLALAANIAFRKENCGKAIARLESWAVDDAGFGGYQRDVGRCRLRNAKLPEAKAAFVRATALSPRDAEAFAGLAETEQALGASGRAWGAYSVAGYLDPDKYSEAAARASKRGGRLELPEHAPADYLLVLAAAVGALRSKAPTPKVVVERSEGIDASLAAPGVLLGIAGGITLVAGLLTDRDPKMGLIVGGAMGLVCGTGLLIGSVPSSDPTTRPMNFAERSSSLDGRGIRASARFSF